jgi:hypothetical protein
MMYLLRFRRCAAPALALALAGCAIHPLPDNSPLNFPRAATFDIVQNVRCELQAGLQQLKNAKGRRKAHIEKMVTKSKVGYDFQFTMTEDEGVGSDKKPGFLTFTYPSSSTLAFDGFATRRRSNVRTFQIIEDLADVREADCSAEARANLAYPISGSLRVDDVVRAYLGLERISDLDKQDVFKDPTGIGDAIALKPDEKDKDLEKFGPPVFAEHLRFRTTLTAGVSATLRLTSVTRSVRVSTQDIVARATRDDNHSLIIGFAREKDFKDDEFNRKARDASAQRRSLREDARSVVRSARAETALAETSSEYARNRLALELARLRNLVDDEQDEARFLGRQLLKALRPPDETRAGN